ncbi:MAG TPA: hypothetical protein VL989_00065 [Candidatus Sulfotelmatobacter sp.]|nr:hypothetical protein [Candidatus Sulfotelmatobacter sp.]
MSERIRLNELAKPEDTQLSPEQVLAAGEELLQYFGVEIRPTDPLRTEEFVGIMDQLNPRFQGERSLVRFELEQDQTEWPDEAKKVIMQAAEKMRMLEPQTPFEGYFDAIIVLAGARQSNLDRLRYAARCLYTRASLLTPIPESTRRAYRHGALVIAGSKRKLQDAEKENVANYAKGAETEEDLVMAAVELVPSIEQKLSEEFGKHPQIMAWGEVIVDGEKVGTPQVVDAVLREAIESHEEGDREFPEDFKLGAVTTQIYQTATELDLARVAKRYGIKETFTAGNPSDPNIIAKRTPATYLSEVLRTLKAAALARAEGVENVGLKHYPIRPYGLGDYYI